MTFDEKHEIVYDRIETLTGERWCPYPSERFLDICMKVDDETLVRLVKTRRQYMFPQFIDNEPMEEVLRLFERTN